MAEVSLQIGATNEGLLQVLQQSADAIKSAATGMAGAFAPVGAAFEALKGAALGLGAIFAGGAAFKESIGTTVELARNSISLGAALGVSATKASDLKVALDSVGVTQDQLAGAANAVTRSLREHEEAFARLGVQTRDQQGNYRSTIDIILDVNAALAKITDGTERNIEGQRIYGRAWQEVQATLRLTPAVMQEATAHAKALGLEVGQEQKANFMAYQAAMAGANDVIKGIGNAIGEALMPMLTALGNWFGSIGPGLVTVFRVAIGGVAIAFNVVGLAVSMAAQVIKAALLDIVAITGRVGASIGAALHGDWAGAAAAWKGGMAELRAIHKAGADQIEADAKAANDRIVAILAGHVATPEPEQQHEKPKPPPDTDRLARWQEELTQQQAHNAQMLADQGEFHEVSKQDEVAYWQNILATNNTSAKEKLAINKTIANLQLGIAKEGFSAQLEQLKEQEAQYKGNLDAKLELAKEYEGKVGAAYGTDSKEYAAAAKEVVAIEREKVAQLLQLNQIREQAQQGLALAQVDQAEQAAQQDLALHKISEAQMLADERTFENERFQIKQQTLQQEKSLINPADDPIAYAKICAQIEALATQHAQKLVQIDQRATRTQLIDWQNLFKSVESAFASNIQKMMQGSETFKQGMNNIFMQIGQAVLQQLAQMAAHWATTQLANLILGKSTASGLVAANAGVAGSAALASFAGAPWPIDVGAPGFAAAMYAEAMSYGLSEKGYDVPAGMMPPLTQLHPKETVLPADIAEEYREAARGPGSRRGTGSGDIHIHTSSIDGKSTYDMLMNNKKAIAKALQAHARKRR